MKRKLKDQLEYLEQKLKKRGRIPLLHRNLVIHCVSDYICRDRSVGIQSGYAVVISEEEEEYIVFDDGEIQDSNGNVIGRTDPIVEDY